MTTKNLEAAHVAVQAARDAAASWATKAANKRDAAATLEAGSGAAVLADESKAAEIVAEIGQLEATARVYDKAAIQSRDNIVTAWREALELEAKERVTESDKLLRDAAKLATEVEALRERLEDLDGGPWERAPIGFDNSGQADTWHTGKAGGLEWNAKKLKLERDLIRFYLLTGKIPTVETELEKQLPDYVSAGLIGMWKPVSEFVPNVLSEAAKEIQSV